MFTDVSMCCDHIIRAPKYHHCNIYYSEILLLSK